MNRWWRIRLLWYDRGSPLLRVAEVHNFLRSISWKRGQGIDLEMTSEQSNNGVERVTYTYCQLSYVFYTWSPACFYYWICNDSAKSLTCSSFPTCSNSISLLRNSFPLAVTNIHTLLTPPFSLLLIIIKPRLTFFYIPSCLRIAYFPFFLWAARHLIFLQIFKFYPSFLHLESWNSHRVWNHYSIFFVLIYKTLA